MVRWTVRATTGVLVLVAALAGCERGTTTGPTAGGSGAPAASPSATVPAGTFAQVADFGPNPGGIDMYVDVPRTLPDDAPVLVAIHGCTDSAQGFHDRTEYAVLAQEHGFLVVYPDANRPGRCFDVSSSAALHRDGGSDPTSIANMVRWVLARYSTDPSRVFVTGYSSGGIMTEVLLADYPDLFAAGSAFAGVPAGCYATPAPPPGSTRYADNALECATGRLTHTPQEWGDLVRAADPGYTGARPRVQLWHGTQDAVLDHANLGEAVKQWTDVLGVAATPVSTDSPAAGTTRTRYGSTGDQPAVEANSEDGVTHQIPLDYPAVLRFFGLDRPLASGGAGTTP